MGEPRSFFIIVTAEQTIIISCLRKEGRKSTHMSYTKEDILRMAKEDDVEFIRMQFTDIFGQLKNVAITASQLEKAVNNQIMIDGSSIEGFARI